jgi:hypothetical protein
VRWTGGLRYLQGTQGHRWVTDKMTEKSHRPAAAFRHTTAQHRPVAGKGKLGPKPVCWPGCPWWAIRSAPWRAGSSSVLALPQALI